MKEEEKKEGFDIQNAYLRKYGNDRLLDLAMQIDAAGVDAAAERIANPDAVTRQLQGMLSGYRTPDYADDMRYAVVDIVKKRIAELDGKTDLDSVRECVRLQTIIELLVYGD